MTTRRTNADRKTIDLQSATAWVRVAENKQSAGHSWDAIAAYKNAARLFERCGESALVDSVNRQIKTLQDSIDSTNMPRRKPIRLPKRTLKTPRRVLRNPEGTTGGVAARVRMFDFIVAYKRRHDGNSPTSREIMDECHISSTSIVHYHLKKMVERGMIFLPDRAAARSIEVRGGQWIFKRLNVEAGDEAE